MRETKREARRLTLFTCPPGEWCSTAHRTMSDGIARCRNRATRVTFYSDGTASPWCDGCGSELETDAEWMSRMSRDADADADLSAAAEHDAETSTRAMDADEVGT